MLHSRDDNDKHVDLPTFPEDAEDARADVPSVPDAQAEFLQGKHIWNHFVLHSSPRNTFVTYLLLCHGH